MQMLRKSTQTVVHIGPLVDATDHSTVETAMTIGTGTAELYQAGATSATDIGANTWAHISGGVYRLTLTVANLSVVGPMMINIHPAGAEPFQFRGTVLEETAYDALTTGSPIAADTQRLNGDATAAANLAESASGITVLEIQAAATTTSIPTNLTETDNNFYAGRTLVITSGAMQGQAATITAYNGTTKTLTVAALTSTPGAGTSAAIV